MAELIYAESKILESKCKVDISIVIPVYNVEEYLEECLDSVWAQRDIQNIKIEVIAVNDGSTDNSLSILQNAQRKHPCLRIISQKNCGLGAARNVGIQSAQGKYIYFLDSDDCLTCDAMSKCYKVSEKDNLDVLLFDAYVFGELKEALCIKDDAYVRKEVIGNQSDIMKGIDFFIQYYPVAYTPVAYLIFMKRDILIKNRIAFPEGVYHEDIQFHNELLFYADRVQYISDCLYKRRYRAGSITSMLTEKRVKDLLQVVEHSWKNALKIGEYQARCLKNARILQNILIDWANSYCSLFGIEGLDDIGKEDLNNIKEGYDLAGEICGRTIEEWSCYCDIEFIYNLYSIFHFAGIDIDLQTSIIDKKQRMLKQILNMLPLGEEKRCVGIYGTGKKANKLLDDYESVFDSIKADIYYIDSNVEENRKYRGRPLISINDLKSFPIDCILIASTKYEAVMRNNIKLLYGSCYEVISLPNIYR